MMTRFRPRRFRVPPLNVDGNNYWGNRAANNPTPDNMVHRKNILMSSVFRQVRHPFTFVLSTFVVCSKSAPAFFPVIMKRMLPQLTRHLTQLLTSPHKSITTIIDFLITTNCLLTMSTHTKSLLPILLHADDLPAYNSPFPTVHPLTKRRIIPFHITFKDFQHDLPPVGLVTMDVVKMLSKEKGLKLFQITRTVKSCPRAGKGGSCRKEEQGGKKRRKHSKPR